ncbi:MAG: hypothetical protein Q9191_003147 [Dirinaria sp. TL-2023a]
MRFVLQFATLLANALVVLGSEPTPTQSNGAFINNGEINSTNTAAIAKASSACMQWLSIANGCAQQTPTIAALPRSDQASCLCYQTISGASTNSISWTGEAYDSISSECAGNIRTVTPLESTTGYKTITHPALCAGAGQVRATSTGGPSTPTRTTAAQAKATNAGHRGSASNFALLMAPLGVFALQ